ncbi:hypothetical protein DPMN_194238 [Dreissena polymorpha]|uniref:Uncharacterized protein n=1 Tax=Dreissena polymorpha TaxID=45954 RepID=A0A9D3Y067_DREPO|nr:hypothetical protein DPMN_194238 [Dreissena polymorpha]
MCPQSCFKYIPKLWTVALRHGNDRYMKYFKCVDRQRIAGGGRVGGAGREDCKMQETFDTRHRSCVF